ncbi:MAG: GIY-YIG nuclease family protein [Tissierellales bacterium]|nr:GIY-YIG nuclease family protein [Tissierellales bacterium]
MACIYKIENLVNGKIYIGSTQNVFNKRKYF